MNTEQQKMTNEERMKERAWDKYDDAIAYLTENPEDIHDAWSDPEEWEGRGGELFGFVGPDWKDNSNTVAYRGEVSGTCGCLQQIRAAYKSEKCGMYALDDTNMTLSHWPDLWERIARDRRLPADSSDIGLEDLPVFAEWQRKLDVMRIKDGMVV